MHAYRERARNDRIVNNCEERHRDKNKTIMEVIKTILMQIREERRRYEKREENKKE